jgi:arylsulfatase A
LTNILRTPRLPAGFGSRLIPKSGKDISHDQEVYYPDVCSDFAVDFIRRHKDGPFYFYLSEHLIHGPILRTPDSKAGADASQLYDDDIKYLDKTVGKLVGELDRLGIRENTVIIFTTDNGTATVGYRPEHDPQHTTGKIGGRAVNGMKGQLLEGGCRVPLVASWKGTLAAGGVKNDLVDFSDLLPTFADLAEARLPAGVKFDGRSFAPQLRGETGQPRDWIFVQLGAGWFARDDQWKMNEKGELFSLKDAPFVEALVPEGSGGAAASAARERLAGVLKELNPAEGKTLTAADLQKAKNKAQKKGKQKAKVQAAQK